MNTKRSFIKALAIAALDMCGVSSALAQADYPNKPIKLIVAFPPGGTSDVMGRLVAEELGKVLKQAIVVENIAGAGGIVGTDRALKLPAGRAPKFRQDMERLVEDLRSKALSEPLSEGPPQGLPCPTGRAFKVFPFKGLPVPGGATQFRVLARNQGHAQGFHGLVFFLAVHAAGVFFVLAGDGTVVGGGHGINDGRVLPAHDFLYGGK